MQQRLPVAAGSAMLTVFLAAAILLPKTTSEVLRDSAFDIELAGDQWLRRPVPSDLKVIVVDIDRASIDALGLLSTIWTVQRLSWRGARTRRTARQQHDPSACMVTLDQTLSGKKRAEALLQD